MPRHVGDAVHAVPTGGGGCTDQYVTVISEDAFDSLFGLLLDLRVGRDELLQLVSMDRRLASSNSASTFFLSSGRRSSKTEYDLHYLRVVQHPRLELNERQAPSASTSV